MPVTIRFENRIDGGLEVFINTGRLTLHSVLGTEDDIKENLSLFQNPAAVRTCGDGKIFSTEKVKSNVQEWAQRWFNQNPLSGFSIYLNENHAFVGCIFLKKESHIPKAAEVGYIISPDFSGKGIATESAKVIVEEYVPEINRRCLLGEDKIEIITATVLTTNQPSINILEKKLGMHYVKTDERDDFPGMRNFYELSLEKILARKVSML